MATNRYIRPQAFLRLIIWISRRTSDLVGSPTITAGTGAPTTTEVDGSIWLRIDGDINTTIYYRVGSAWVALSVSEGANDIADPGDGNAIPVTASGSVSLVTGGAETRTLAIPTFIGQVLNLSFDTDVGDCVVTASAAVNQAGNNTLTFTDVGEIIVLTAIEIAGALVWRDTANDGVALTTV